MNDNMNMGYPEKEQLMQNQFQPGFNDSGSMQIRLQTEPIKKKIYMYLTGMAVTYKIDEKNPSQLKEVLATIGEPLANGEGVKGIMLFIEQVINSQTVQGNISEEGFGKLMHDFRKGLMRHLWINMQEFGINENKFDGVVDGICLMVKPFLSRTVNNGERESYGKSWQIKDSNTTLPAKRRGIMNMIPFLN